MQIAEWLTNLCISEVNAVNIYQMDADKYPMKNKGRYHHGLIYTMEGIENFTFYDKKISAVPDSVLYIPKGEKYVFDLTGAKGYTITIDFTIISPEPIRPVCIKCGNGNSLRSDFADAAKIWRRQTPDHAVLCKSLFYKIIAFLIRQESSYLNPKSYAKIAEAVDYLHQHYTDHDFKIDTLFHMSDISPRHFESLFYERFHATPKEYVISMKMERAKELLQGESISIGEIADQLGYGDLYHFSKIFKAKTGYSPSEFRRPIL